MILNSILICQILFDKLEIIDMKYEPERFR
jgi:hypothetical protein